MKSGILVVAALAATACGSHEETTLESTTFTATQAQQRISENLAAAIADLPGGVHLSKTSDNPGLSAFGKERPVSSPCWEGSAQTTGMYYLSSSYWMSGVPAGENRAYYDATVRAWEERGWAVEHVSAWVTTATLPDKFGLRLQDADEGDGSLSVTGMSACVHESTIDDVVAEPETINHP
ncbi:hypothetical protein ACFC06_13475 [Nocardia sp. NPDC056064]|uniref:hypothetical protein n=1 Tax=Nocardia sp. NPDC056064 TaxID=3345701 RepID=UPI0035D54F8E